MASSSRPISRHGRKFREYKPLTPPSDEELPSFSTMDYENTEEVFVPRDNPIIERPKTSRGYRSRGERPPSNDSFHDNRPTQEFHSHEGRDRPISRRGRPHKQRPDTFGHPTYDNRKERRNYDENRRDDYYQENRSKRYRGNDEILYQSNYQGDPNQSAMMDYPGSRNSNRDTRPQFSRENSFISSPPHSANRSHSPKISREAKVSRSAKSKSSQKTKTTHESHRAEDNVVMRPPSTLGKYTPLPAIGHTADYSTPAAGKQDTLSDRISRMTMQNDFAEYHYSEPQESEDDSKPYYVDEANSFSDEPIDSGRRYSIETNDSGQRYVYEGNNRNRRLSTETNDSGQIHPQQGNSKRRYSVEMPNAGEWYEDRYTDEDVSVNEQHFEEGTENYTVRQSGEMSNSNEIPSDSKTSALESNVLVLGGSDDYFTESSGEFSEPMVNEQEVNEETFLKHTTGDSVTSNVPNPENQITSSAFVKNDLPPEPSDNERRTLLAIHLPDGKRYERYFRLSEPLIHVLYFAENMSSTALPNHFLACNAPRHVFVKMDKLIGQLDLPDRTLLYVEKRSQ